MASETAQKSEQIITVVSPRQRLRADAVADDKGISRSELMRRALDEYLDKHSDD